MNMSKLLTLILYISLVFIWISFIAVGEGELVDVASLFLVSLLILALVFFLATITPRTAPIVVIWVVIMFPFFVLRFIALFFFPEQMWLGHLYVFGPQEMNWALLYLLVGTVVIGLGFVFGSNLTSSRVIAPPDPDEYSSRLLRRCAVIAIISVVIQLIGILFFDYGNMSSLLAPRWHAMLTILWNNDAALIIAIVVTGECWKASTKTDKRLMIAYYGIYILSSLISGARIALLRPLYWGLSYLLVRRGDIQINSRQIVRIALLLLIATIGIYPLGTAFKNAWNVHGGEMSLTPSMVWELATTVGYGYEIGDIGHHFLFRLAGLDTVMIVLNRTGPVAREYLTFDRVIKVTVNQFTPGFDPFPEARISTARIFGAIYAVRLLEQVTDRYQSYLWTLWGISYAHFGWAGGLVFMFVVSFLLSAIYQRALWLRSHLSIMIGRTWLLIFVVAGINNAGFDSWVVPSMHILISMGFLLAIVSLKPSKSGNQSTSIGREEKVKQSHGRASFVSHWEEGRH